MKAFALYDTKLKQISTTELGHVLIFTRREDAEKSRIGGEVITMVDIKMAMKSPRLRRTRRAE